VLFRSKIEGEVIKDIKSYGYMAGNGLRPEERYQHGDTEIYVLFENDQSSKWVQNEKVGTGDGTALIFDKTLSMKPIEHTLTIIAIVGGGAVSTTDDGNGHLIDTVAIDGNASTINYETKLLHLVFKTGKAPDDLTLIKANYTERSTVEIVKDILEELMIISRPKAIFIGEPQWAIEEPLGWQVVPVYQSYASGPDETTFVILKDDFEYSFYSPDGYMAVKSGNIIFFKYLGTEIGGSLIADGVWTDTDLTLKLSGNYVPSEYVKIKRAMVPLEDEKWAGAYRGFKYVGRI
jgi:hypothetical protein